MAMYNDAKTAVRMVYGIGIHQGSGLRPLLFVTAMEAISGLVYPWNCHMWMILAVTAD